MIYEIFPTLHTHRTQLPITKYPIDKLEAMDRFDAQLDNTAHEMSDTQRLREDARPGKRKEQVSNNEGDADAGSLLELAGDTFEV